MKKATKIWGGYNFLLVAWLMLFSAAVSRGQGTPPPTNPNASEPITGEQLPASGQPVTYQHHFDELSGASWHIEGAAAINGTPIALIPNGDVPAEGNEVTITWDKVPRGLVQLLKANEGTAATLMGNLVVYPDQQRAAICPSGELWYRGQVSSNGNASQGRVSPINICPNVSSVAGLTPPATQPYEFEFDAYCIGNFYSNNNGRYYVWTLEYTTAANNVYRESWYTYGSSRTIARFYMFDVVPSGVPSNFNRALNWDQNSSPANFSQYTPSSTAMAGERIVSVNVKCKGYSCSCGWADPFFRDKEDDVNVQYYGQQPTGITLNGGTLPLCRSGQPYTLTAGTVFDATNYSWTASNGATISGIGGNNATVNLNLTNTSAAATAIVVTARAVNSNSTCAPANSPPISLTLALAPPPAGADNISISRESCTATMSNPKTATASRGGLTNDFYSWSISGSNATFLSGLTTQPSTQSAVAIVTPMAGPVTITAVRETNGCNGRSVAFSRTFNVGPQPISCPSPRVAQPVGGWCNGIADVVSVAAPPPGFSLIITDAYSIGAGTVTFNQGTVTNGLPSASLTLNGATNIRLRLLLQDECDPFGPGRYLNCNIDFVPTYAAICRAPDPQRPALYPNPSSGDVTIATTAGKPMSYEWLKVRDVQGRTVLEKTRQAGNELNSFNIQTLPSGIYEVQLYDGKSVTTSRISRE